MLPHNSTVPVLLENDGATENDDDWQYMLPPIGEVAHDPFGAPGTIWCIVHTPRDTWVLLVPGGWLRSEHVDFGPR